MKGDLSFGTVAFIVGLIAAVVIGVLEAINVMPEWNWLPWVMIGLGLVVGLLNVTNDEAKDVMLAGLTIGATAGLLTVVPAVGGALDAILSKIALLALPSALVTGIKVWIDRASH